MCKNQNIYKNLEDQAAIDREADVECLMWSVRKTMRKVHVSENEFFIEIF